MRSLGEDEIGRMLLQQSNPATPTVREIALRPLLTELVNSNNFAAPRIFVNQVVVHRADYSDYSVIFSVYINQIRCLSHYDCEIFKSTQTHRRGCWSEQSIGVYFCQLASGSCKKGRSPG